MSQAGLAGGGQPAEAAEAAGAPAPGIVAKVMPRYRADIDGLRAIAVLAVILTHARVAGFTGGFIGVDIFFVISGYLIYRDLTARAREGRFSLLGFYGRRTRRTLPALYLVGFTTLAGATTVLMPGELDETARSLAAAVLLVPNIFFLTQAGYFDALAGSKPLLHTWSLGVEEQFYLFAPLLPLLLGRLAAAPRRLALAALFVASLAAALILRQAAPAAAFYLMPTRAFEFLIGAAIVEGMLPPLRRPWLAELVALAALATLAASIVLFTDATPHPGLPTLAPCIATAVLIHVGATRQTVAGSLLGLRGMAFIGLISYSLYLWHWPILVLSHAARLPEGTPLIAAQAVLLFALSVLSWRFVETPFRDPASAWRRRGPVLIPASGVVLLAASVTIVELHGLPQRLPPAAASVAAYYSYRDTKPFREGRCFITSKDRASAYDRATCLKIVPGAANVLLLGDSHAAHLWTALHDTWPKLNLLQATASGCKPVFGTAGASRCTEMMGEMLEHFIPEHRLDALIIGGLWEIEDVEPLKRTIAALTPHVGRIVVFGPMPRYDEPLATLLARDMMHGDLADVATHRLESVPPLDARMHDEIGPIATYVSPYRIICPENRCRTFAAPGVPMQFDYHHLTPAGADLMMTVVRAEHPKLFDSR